MAVLFLTVPNKVVAQKTIASIPDGSIVSAYLRQRVTSESGGALSLAGFRKTNGYDPGFGFYIVEWQADILLQQDCWRYMKMSWNGFHVITQQPLDTEDPNNIWDLRYFKEGTVFCLIGQSTLRNTEQGWRIEEEKYLNVKTFQVITVTQSKVPAPANNDTPLPSTGLPKAVVIKENANLRKTPGQNGKVVNKVTKLAIVEIIKQNGAWFLVKYAKATGWMHGNTIRLYTDTTP